MPKTLKRKLKIPASSEPTPISVIGTRRWKEGVPKHLQIPLAKALHAMEEGRLGESLIHFGECATLEPLSKPVLYFGAEAAARGYFLMKGRTPHHPQLDEWKQVAEDLHRYLVELDPSDAVASHSLGRFIQDEGRDEEAVAIYKHTLMLDSDQLETWGNLGNAYYQIGKVEDGWRCWNRCLTRPASKASESIAQSYVYLRKGDYLNGWRCYNERWNDRSFADGYARKDLGGIHWKGEKLPRGSRLYLHGEQGGGDHVQFARYIPLLQNAGYDVVALETRDVLIRWMASALAPICVVERGSEAAAEIVFSHHCSTLDLPGILGTTLETIPQPVAPVFDEWYGHVEGEPLRIGIAWEGAKGNTADIFRSIPPSELRHLADIPGVTWVSLQFADDAAMTARAWLGRNYVDGTEGCMDALDTAKVMHGLDLVITVDTMTAHLAGSLGIPTWILHRFCREWRWLDESVAGEHCPWYPSAVSLTQAQPGDWTELLLRVRQRIEAMI